MKAGDKLYYYQDGCIFTSHLAATGFRELVFELPRQLTIGKCYIVNINEHLNINFHEMRFYIINDAGKWDYYSDDPENKWYYKKFFYTETELRKLKLNKLKNCKDVE